jgi:hypothetical protein
MSARAELYAAVMDGGYHSPDRSEKASARIDAYRAEVLAEAAAELIAFCPDHGNRDTAFITCQCLAAEDLLSKAGAQ